MTPTPFIRWKQGSLWKDISALKPFLPFLNAKERRYWVWIVAAGFLGLGIWALFFVNPLPSDETMIVHLREHRSEIERLVKHYREYQRPGNPSLEWHQLPEILVLRESSGVRNVSEAGAVWLPDPYSAQTAQRLDSLARTDGQRYFSVKRRFGSIAVSLSDPRYGMRPAIVKTSLAGAIWKDYFFFQSHQRLISISSGNQPIRMGR
jgi:hypothetical protein